MGSRVGSSWASLEIDPDQVQVLKEGKEILLSPREFKLLHTLAQSPGRVFPRTALLRQVWGEEEYIDERTVNVYVQRLRNKLGDNPNDPKLIETVRGFGYRLVRPASVRRFAILGVRERPYNGSCWPLPTDLTYARLIRAPPLIVSWGRTS